MFDEEATSNWLVGATHLRRFDFVPNLADRQDLRRDVAAQTFTYSFLTRVVRAYHDHLRGTDLESVAQFDVSRVLIQSKYSAKRLLLLDLEDTLWTRKTAGFIKQGSPFPVPGWIRLIEQAQG